MDKKTTVTVIVVFAVIIAVCVPLAVLQNRRAEEKAYREKWGNIAVAAETDERAQYIIDHEELYSKDILDCFDIESEKLINFVYNYPFHKDDYKTMTYTPEELSGEKIPALYMADTRWAYQRFKGGYIQTDGCAAVCLTMAYLYLTQKDDIDPYKVGLIAEQCDGIGVFGGITDKKIPDMCAEMGLKVKMTSYSADRKKTAQVDIETIKEVIDSGHVLMAGMAGETFGVHAIIITGYEGEALSINDPANPEKTAKKWNFEDIEPEMMYLYDISV